MLRTKIKYENKQRAMTQKLSKQELRFMCTALPLDEIYPPTKFHLYKWSPFDHEEEAGVTPLDSRMHDE